MKNKFSSTTKDFFPIDTIVDDLIKLKDGTYVKIIKVDPINLNLKTSFEQQAIIFSYKNFLQSLNFDIQIIIQSKKADIKNHLNNINSKSEKNPKIQELLLDYTSYIQEKKNDSLSSKNFYIVISSNNKGLDTNYENIKQDLYKKYQKIKSELLKCGNICTDFSSNKKEINQILFSFLNTRLSNIIT